MGTDGARGVVASGSGGKPAHVRSSCKICNLVRERAPPLCGETGSECREMMDFITSCRDDASRAATSCASVRAGIDDRTGVEVECDGEGAICGTPAASAISDVEGRGMPAASAPSIWLARRAPWPSPGLVRAAVRRR